ncbi:MAG: ABC transporter ATP-binding protein [Firmicutes bacterium]|nr:ABC transporter ATP-binding protein [Bacillota bacterium]
MSQLICKNLNVGYEDGVVASGIDFAVESGDYLCIVGENGSGKTTLMKTILGLTPPLSGEIYFEDGLSSKSIGYLPQQTLVQKDFPASVFEIVLSGCLSKLGRRPFYSKEDKALALEKMQKLGIENLTSKSYRNLSGGQQQRVLLARALCAAEKMLLLDEPTAGLDPAATNEMYDYIKKLNDEGMTIIMITHDLEESAKYATKTLNMGKDGVCHG